ncbi:MAG: sigma 54-interacting transcriptional regulator [Armatimonadetes bacterium]|nr:sigma 54-interacting transcriptional regulator [Armatimonadota bacterium]
MAPIREVFLEEPGRNGGNSFGLYLADARAKTIGVDRVFEILTETERGEVLGRFTYELENGNYVDRSVTMLVLRYRRPVTIEQTWLRTGKRVIVTGNPVFNSRGEIVLVTTAFYPPEAVLENRQESISPGFLPVLDGVVAVSRQMQEVLMRAARVAPFETTVLLCGETGVGKEVVARIIHQLSPRRNKNFLRVNLGAIPKELFESELFGYRAGAFTGASRTGKKGFVQAANGGTLFLDEVSEIPLSVQVKLLGVLQEKELVPVGGVQTEKVDVRFLAATNRDLKIMVQNGLFREDLYYRLNVVPIYIPPLRERKEDIFALVHHFLSVFKQQLKIEKQISSPALEVLMDYPWPGNVRELKNLMERLAALYPQELITREMVLAELGELSSLEPAPKLPLQHPGYRGAMAQFEKELLRRVLKKHANIEEAARELGVHRTTLLRKMRKYRLQLDLS